MEHRTIGALIIVAGLAAAVVGLLVWMGALSWFGRLPGDIRIERDGVRIYVPIVSMLLASVAISLILWIARKYL